MDEKVVYTHGVQRDNNKTSIKICQFLYTLTCTEKSVIMCYLGRCYVNLFYQHYYFMWVFDNYFYYFPITSGDLWRIYL